MEGIQGLSVASGESTYNHTRPASTTVSGQSQYGSRTTVQPFLPLIFLKILLESLGRLWYSGTYNQRTKSKPMNLPSPPELIIILCIAGFCAILADLLINP